AEDGIRDFHVTGVQTCALPIFAAVAEAGSLDGSDLEAATELVDDEGRKRFAFDVFSNDEQRTRGLDDGFENGEHRLKVRELLLRSEERRVGKEWRAGRCRGRRK